MREILFKAKYKYDGEWKVGGIVHQTDFYGLKVDKYFIIDGTETEDNDIGYNYEVIPETVSQFTGLYDKNGVMIYENDIVRFTCTPSWLYQVIWDKESAMFGLKCVKSPSLYNKEACGTNFYDIDSRDVEIIGNVFDNSDLLKGE